MSNTIDKWEYIKEHIIWSFVMFVWCKKMFFRCVPNCTYIESLLVLLGVAVSVMAVGIAITWKNGRNYISLAENIILTWSVFVVLAYVDIFKNRMIAIGIVVVILSALMTVIVLCRRIKRKYKKRTIITNRIRNVVNLWRRNFAFASLFLLIPLGASVLINGTVLNSKVEGTKVYGDEHCLDANIEVIANIAPERWERLDIQDRLTVLQTILNCQARYYGLSHEIVIGTADLSEGTLAYYSEAKHQIVIDIDYLKDSYSYDILETSIHECTHAYQHEQVALYQKLDDKSRNLLMFHDVSIYMEEFADYEDGSEDFWNYYSQKAEIDARKAGETESLEYIQRVNVVVKHFCNTTT